MTRADDGNLNTSIHCKPILTDQFLNFYSNHPVSNKRSVVSTLIKRGYLIPSTVTAKKQEESHLRAVFASNYTKDLYIGQTGRRLDQRLCEHKRAVKTADFNSSALAEHAWSAGHAVDWENVSIVNRCPHLRIVSEAIVIRTTSNTLNRDSGSLPVVYDNLL